MNDALSPANSMRNVYRMWRAVGFCLVVSACGGDIGGGPVDVKLIQPVGPGCKYAIAPARIESLDSLLQMRGAIGRVVISSENLNSRPEILDLGAGLFPVDV